MTRNTIEAIWLVLALALVFFASYVALARAHEAPSGWTYSIECCSSYDCQEITPEAVIEGPDGITVTLDADTHKMLKGPASYTLPYGDKRIKDSPDGVFHACISKQMPVTDGFLGGRLICLYVPPKGF